MSKFFNKFLASAILVVLLSGTAFAAAPNFFKPSGSGLVPATPFDELGTNAARWAKGYFTDLDVSGVFTFGGIASGSFDLNGNSLIFDLDGDTSMTADTDDQIDIAISAADDFQFVANIFRAVAGSVIETNAINETTVGSGVTIDGTLIKDNSITELSGITSPLNTSLVLSGNGTGLVKVGTCTATAGNSNDDLCVGGITELKGSTYIGNTFFQAAVVSPYGYSFSGNSDTSGRIVPNSAFGQVTLTPGTTSNGNQFVIGATALQDFDHAAQTNPTLYIHSATAPDTLNTEWLSLAHDQTNAVIDSGKGQVSINGVTGVNLKHNGTTALNVVNNGSYTTLMPAAGDYTRIGDGGTATTVGAEDDLLVTGNFEAKGIGYFFDDLNISGGDVTSSLGFVSGTTAGYSFGAVNDAYSKITPSTSFDQIVWSIGANYGTNLVFGASSAQDYDHADNSVVSTYWHSATLPNVSNNEFGGVYHDGTGFNILTGPATGAGTAPTTIANYISLQPQGIEAFRAHVLGATVSANIDTATGATLDVYTNSATPAANDVGYLDFAFNNAAAAKTTIARVQGVMIDTTAGAEVGGIQAYTQFGAGTMGLLTTQYYDGTNAILGVGDAVTAGIIESYEATPLIIRPGGGSTATRITMSNAADTDMTIAVDGTGALIADTDLVLVGDGTNPGTIRGNNSQNLVLDTSTSSITIPGGAANTTITPATNLGVSLGGFILTPTTQTLASGPGAIDVVSAISLISTTAADAFTLADGVAGQTKTVVMVSDGGNGTLTPTNFGGTNLVFDDAGDTAMLLFINTKWYFTGGTATYTP